VAPARLEGSFDDEVWSLVEGVVRLIVEKTATDAGRPDEEIVSVAMGSKCGLSTFDRRSQSELVAEVFGDSKTVLPRPAKADVILVVNAFRCLPGEHTGVLSRCTDLQTAMTSSRVKI
jgi:hypothetical protein